MELETQVVIGHRLGYFTCEQARSFEASAGEVGRLINGLSNSLKTDH